MRKGRGRSAHRYVCRLLGRGRIGFSRGAGCSCRRRGRETDARRIDGEGQGAIRTAGTTKRKEARASKREKERENSWTEVPPPRRRMLHRAVRWLSRGRKRRRRVERRAGVKTERERDGCRRRESEKTVRKTRAVADRENAKEITLPGASETAREGRGSLSRPGRRDKDEADKRTDEGARGRGYSVSRPRATRAHAPSRPAVQPATTPSSSSSSPPYHPAHVSPFHPISLISSSVSFWTVSSRVPRGDTRKNSK